MDRELQERDRVEHEFGIDEFGTTTNPMQHQTEALKARIFHGANKIEFSFFGHGKGNKEQPTPETFGRRERQDMRELAEFNKVETTTHASVNVMGLSGLNMQAHKFDDRQRKETMDEIKRAIHFAADATTGGAVVFHTGEAPRYLYGRWQDERGQSMFKAFPEEEKRKAIYLADPLTKNLVAEIRPIDKIAKPIYKTDEKGNIEYLKDENGEFVVDKQLEAVDRMHHGKIPLYKTDEKGDIKTQLITFEEFQEERKEQYKNEYGREPTEEELAKDFFYQQRFVDVMYNLYFGIRQEREYNESLKNREKLIKALNFYKDLKEKIPEEDWWKFQKEGVKSREIYDAIAQFGFIPPDRVDPIKYLEEEIRENERNISHIKELSLHGRRTATEQLDMVRRAKLADKFAMEQTANSMAELGVYAWQMTQKAHDDFKNGKTHYDLKKDIFIAPENLWPETYGSHPDELRNIVLKGRKAMVEELKSNYGMKEKEAEKVAKKHIKATFDIGHANMWKKFFVSKPDESLEDRNKRFNKWLLGKTKELVDEGIIGHVHVNDNFGFHDEHLIAGDGNAPIKEFIEQAKKAGLKDFIVESGSFNALISLPDTWAHFGSPVYHVAVPGITRDGWTDIWHSYFGRTEPPRYVVGDYAPSTEFKGEPFYTGLSLE